MSDYTQITDFSAKDALSSGDPEKVATGADVDAELAAISTAIATKADDSAVVHDTGTETVAGDKTFTGNNTHSGTGTHTGNNTFVDGAGFAIIGSSDATKKVQFEVDGLTTGTTRTVTCPDADLTLLSAATQAEMEAVSSTTAAVTPGRQHFHPAIPKFVGAMTSLGSSPPTITAFFNALGALTPARNAQGDHTLTWTNSLSNVHVHFGTESNSTANARYTALRNGGASATAIRFLTEDAAATLTDVTTIYIFIYGDLA